jgi:hypothetical protein
MASKTKGELISDLELMFTQGKPSDDLELEREQIAKWLDDASNMVVSDQLGRQLAKGENINPVYIKKSAYIQATSENIAQALEPDQRYKIDISSLDILPIRGLGRDYGVIRVHDERNIQLTNITYDDSDFYRHLWFASPSCQRIHWYRENGEVYLDGVDANLAAIKRFRVFYVGTIESSALSDGDPYPIGDDIVSMVVGIAYENGLKQLQDGFMDLQNDGKQA